MARTWGVLPPAEAERSIRAPTHGSIADIARGRFARLVRRAATTRVGVWLIGHVVSPLQRQLYRRSGGRISLTGSAPVLLLTTIGRRTGKPRTVPVFYLRDGKRFIVCNVNPGFEQPNPWTLNLRANASARVQVGAVTIEVRARGATDEEIARYWPDLVGLWPAYDAFYERGGSRSVFILEPDGHVAAGRSA